MSGSIHVVRSGLCRVDGPAPMDPARPSPTASPTNRFRHWWGKGIVQVIFSGLARSAVREEEADTVPKAGAVPEEVLMIDATCVKAHRTASSLKKGVPSLA